LSRGEILFNAEPEERMTQEEIAEFEKYVGERQKKLVKEAAWSIIALATCNLCLAPFLYGHSLHRYWAVGRFLIPIAFLLLLWVVKRVGAVWASWQSARETRREFREPL
jgi:hypothetical protein